MQKQNKTKKPSNNFISIFSPRRSQSDDKHILSAPSVTKTLCQLGAMGPGEWDRLCDQPRLQNLSVFSGRTANELMEERRAQAGVELIKHLYVRTGDVGAVALTHIRAKTQFPAKMTNKHTEEQINSVTQQKTHTGATESTQLLPFHLGYIHRLTFI